MLVRALTAVVLLAAFLAAFAWLDAFGFSIVVGAIVAVGAWEWSKLCGISGPARFASAAACVALWQAMLEAGGGIDWMLAAAALFWIIAAPYWLSRGLLPGPRAVLLATGLLVLVPAGVAMVVLPRDWLLVVLGLVWIADTAAYLSGRAFGKHKLAPSISPGKTWEGVAGAAVSCLIYAIICAMLVPSLRAQVQGAVWVFFLLGAALACAASVLGDLFESALKRRAGAKDSGSILPGHGGVLDRIDAITAALPIGALLMRQLPAA